MKINELVVPKVNSILEGFSGNAGLFIKDLNDGETFCLREKEVCPIASIIKLLILWELFTRIDLNEISLLERRKITDSTKELPGGIKIGGCGVLKILNNGLEPTIYDLATLMITISDNVATGMLIDELGIDKINEKALILGLTNTKLKHKPYGVKQEKTFNNLSTPEDIALLLELYINSNLLSSQSRSTMIDILKKQQLKNKLPKLLPVDFPLAHKTGDLPGVENDAGIFEFSDRKVIAVVVTNDMDNNDEGVLLCNKIGKLVYDTFAS